MFRRQFCTSLAATVSVAGIARNSHSSSNLELPPIRAITRGPKHHWRGYYDNDLFDANDRFLLANQVDFEGRTPEPMIR